MSPLKIRLAAELLAQGDTYALFGVLPESEYEVGGRPLPLKDGIRYELQFIHAGTSIMLVGTVTAEATAECARCLEPADVLIEGPVENYYLFTPPSEEDDLEEDEFELLDDEGAVDIAPALRAALVLATPLAVLCDEDCKGLCPQCGVNLNNATCACDSRPDQNSPFMALKDFDCGS